MKRCIGCLVDKEESEFGRHRARPDGLQDRCRVCANALQMARYYANHASKRAAKRAYAKRNPEKIREQNARDYKRNGERRRAVNALYREKNREKLKQLNRDYYLANRETCLAKLAEYRRVNRGKWRVCHNMAVAKSKARRKQVTLHKFGTSDVLARMVAQGDRCIYCDAPWEHVDHCKPLSKGGPHCLANLRPACRACNYAKRAQSPIIWLAKPNSRGTPLPLP